MKFKENMMKYIIMLLISTQLIASVGKITAFKGNAFVYRSAKALKVKIGMAIKKNDMITTKADTRVQIVFNDNTIVSLGQYSSFSIEDYFYDIKQVKKVKAKFQVAIGTFKVVTGLIGKISPDKFKLKTKSASIGIRGTIFFGEVTQTYENIICTQGKIVVSTSQGMVDVDAGKMTKIINDKPPTPAILLPKTKKIKLEQSSGAKANEKESGQTIKVVEKKAQALKQVLKKSKTKQKVKIDKKDNTLSPIISKASIVEILKQTKDKEEEFQEFVYDNKLDKIPKEETNLLNKGDYTVMGSGYTSDGNDLRLTSSSYYKIDDGVFKANEVTEISQQNGNEPKNIKQYTTLFYSINLSDQSASLDYAGFKNIASFSDGGALFVDDKYEFWSKIIDVTDGSGYKMGIVGGVATSSNKIENLQKVSHYNMPDISSKVGSDNQIASNSNDTIYSSKGVDVNWKTKSVFSVDITKDTQNMIIGHIIEDENKNVAVKTKNISIISNDNSPSVRINDGYDGYVFGSQHQGLGLQMMDNTQNNNNITYGLYREKNDKQAVDYNGKSASGFATGDNKININFANTGISGNIKSLSSGDNNINFGGNYNDNKSAYISADKFGATIGDDDMIVTIDDEIDDGISWGIWTKTTDREFWVASVNDRVESISDWVNTNSIQIAKYSGSVLGSLSNGTEIDEASSSIDFTLDFGKNELTADLNINGTEHWGEIDTTNLTTTESGHCFSGSSSGSSLKGGLYDGGSSSIGNFYIKKKDSSGLIAAGVYKAQKQ